MGKLREDEEEEESVKDDVQSNMVLEDICLTPRLLSSFSTFPFVWFSKKKKKSSISLTRKSTDNKDDIYVNSKVDSIVNSIERDKTNIARSISTNTNINNCACEDVNDKNNNCYNNISGSESDTCNINIKIKQQEQQTEKEAVILRLKKVVEMENDKRYNQKYRRIKQQQSFLSLKHMFLPITMLRFPRKEEEVTKRNESENSNDAMKEMSKKGDKIQTA